MCGFNIPRPLKPSTTLRIFQLNAPLRLSEYICICPFHSFKCEIFAGLNNIHCLSASIA